MSSEALRLTSRSPSELHGILGPHGVDELLRDARNACWRECPAEQRTLPNVRRIVTEVFDRNMAVWSKIKKASPAAFFENLLPNAADGHMRQALVLCWMMLPRGKRSLKVVGDVVSSIFQRQLDAWVDDERTFTKGPPSKAGKAPKSPAKAMKPKRKGKSR